MTDDFIFAIINRGMFKFKTRELSKYNLNNNLIVYENLRKVLINKSFCNIGVTANIYYGYYILIMKEL